MWRVPARYLSSRAVIWRSAIVARWPSGGGARKKAGPFTRRPSTPCYLNSPRLRSLAMLFLRIATRMKPGPSARVHLKIGFISSRALFLIILLDLFESWANMWNCCSGIGPVNFDPGDSPASDSGPDAPSRSFLIENFIVTKTQPWLASFTQKCRHKQNSN